MSKAQPRDYINDYDVPLTLTCPPRYRQIAENMVRDLATLVHKNEQYGESWKRRGGKGAWFTLVRPWDRLEEMVRAAEDDIFAAGDNTHHEADSDILDSIRDVRNYLHLIEDEILRRRRQAERAHRHEERLSESKMGRNELETFLDPETGEPYPPE